MLELRTYTYKEMSAMFGTRDTQGIKRRLTRYGIEYTVAGSGGSAKFNINAIPDPFKVFCIYRRRVRVSFCSTLPRMTPYMILPYWKKPMNWRNGSVRVRK